MERSSVAGRPMVRASAALALAFVVLACGADGGGGGGGGGAVNAAPANPTLEAIMKRGERFGQIALEWYRRTPPVDRVTWGGLGACGVLGLMVMAERMLVLRRRRVTPRNFLKRFRERLQDGRLDRGKALDLCELNPSPAARVALAAVRRWGRPVADVERAVALASRVETDLLRRNVGTLRRIAAMSPLLGLLGSLIAAGRALAVPGATWGPALGNSLIPLTSGVALAIVALVAYDGFMGRVEKLANAIDRLGAETVDAIAMSASNEPSSHAHAHPHVQGPAHPRPIDPRRMTPGPYRGPHQIRVEIPDSIARNIDRDLEDEYED